MFNRVYFKPKLSTALELYCKTLCKKTVKQKNV